MSEPIDSKKSGEPDLSRFVAPSRRRSGYAAGWFGCMAGAGIGVAGAVLFAFLLMGNSNVKAAAVVSILAALAGGALAFRRFRREDPPVAVGLLIGLALIGLLAGMCAGQLG